MYFQTICRINCEARDESLKFTCFPMSLKSSVLNEKKCWKQRVCQRTTNFWSYFFENLTYWHADLIVGKQSLRLFSDWILIRKVQISLLNWVQVIPKPYSLNFHTYGYWNSGCRKILSFMKFFFRVCRWAKNDKDREVLNQH